MFGHFAGKKLGHGGFFQAGQASVAQGGGVPDELARGLNLCRCVSQFELHGLMAKNRLTKGPPLFAVGQRGFKRGARHAQGLRGNADAPALQARQGNAQTQAFFADEVFCRHAAVVEDDLRRVAGVLAHLVFNARHCVTWSVGRHDESADALLACSLVGDRHDDGDVAVFATGDELFDAVQHVVVTLQHGRGPQATGFAAHLRFGQAKRAQHVAARQGFQEAFFLISVAEGHQDGADRAVVDTDDGAGGTTACGHFFQDE